MDIKINSFQPNLMFMSRKKVGYTQFQMLQTVPEMLKKGTALEEISKVTGRSQSSLLTWIKENTGRTYHQFQKTAEMESYRESLIKYINEGKKISEMADLIGRGVEWTRKCLDILGLCKTRKSVDLYLKEQVPALVKEGYTIENIAQMLNSSRSKIQKVIDESFNKSIVKIRHQNGIRLRHYEDEKYAELKKELEGYLDKGMTLSEISKKTGRPNSRIVYWLRIFGLETDAQKSHRLMKENVPDMMQKKIKLKNMAKEIGVSKATISRWIKKTFGKSYTDIRLNR